MRRRIDDELKKYIARKERDGWVFQFLRINGSGHWSVRVHACGVTVPFVLPSSKVNDRALRNVVAQLERVVRGERARKRGAA